MQNNPSVVESHYETLLAARYTWMMGGPERCLQNARELMDFARVAAPASGKALDLGCGGGYHATALTERGLEVIAVDNSPVLLDELRAVCAGLRVNPVLGDLSPVTQYAAHGLFSLVVCVGDTLTHLSSRDAVQQLIRESRKLLAPGGALLLEFREQLKDLPAQDCVLTTRAERDCIMQCVLHYETDRVWVTDVVHDWDGGVWRTIKSTYPKLRLSGEQLASYAASEGFRVEIDGIRAGRRVLLLRT